MPRPRRCLSELAAGPASAAASTDALGEREPSPREARLEIRLTREQKSLVHRAAAARGVSVAEFVRRATQEAALETITEHTVLHLCVQDQEAFATALLASKEPGPALREAHRLYRGQVEG